MSQVWITGASSGIGEALAREYARSGWDVVLSARRKERLEELQKEFKGYGVNASVVPLDLADSSAFQSLAKETWTSAGPIDLLINNGGISQRSMAMDTSLEVDRRLMEVDYFGTIALTKAVLPLMVENGGGHIATITSLVGVIGSPWRSAYAAAKHALHGFFDSLRAEMQREQNGVYVSLICPGFIKTELSKVALTGSGTELGQMDDAQAKGMPTDVMARKVKSALDKKKAEIHVGGFEINAIKIFRWFPGIFRRMLVNAKVR